MTTAERLKVLQEWLYKECCEGREMKCPNPDGIVADVTYEEPTVFIGFYPTRTDETGIKENPISTVPSLLIMFGQGFAERMQEQRFDRYSGIHRPKELGGTIPIAILFATYDPGDRMERFEDVPSPEFLVESTEQGLFTLTNWMDDVKAKLLGTVCIPGTDMFLWKDTLSYSPLTESGQIVDKRPFYYAFINCEFGLYSDRAINARTADLID